MTPLLYWMTYTLILTGVISVIHLTLKDAPLPSEELQYTC